MFSKAEGTTCADSSQCQSGLICKSAKCSKPSTTNCTAEECPIIGQYCECPATANGAGTCVGSVNYQSTALNAFRQVFQGYRNTYWMFCQIMREFPTGYVDPIIPNLVCTAGANAIKVSIGLLVALLALVFYLV